MDLRTWATRTPRHPAVVCAGRRLDYAALEALANRLAAVWRSLGLQRGEHVATLMGNVPEALAAAWAAWRCGLYLTPVPHTLAAPEAAALIGDCDARALLADGGSQLPWRPGWRRASAARCTGCPSAVRSRVSSLSSRCSTGRHPSPPRRNARGP